MFENLALYPYPSVILFTSGIILLLLSNMTIDDKKSSENILNLFGQFFGFCWGITALTWGIITLGSPIYTGWMVGGLILVGLSLFLRPLKNIPWATLVGLIFSGAITAFLAMNMDPVIHFGIDFRWILAIVFLAVMFILYLICKFIEDLFELIGLILSNDPISMLIGLGCFIGGIASLVIYY